jgi:NADPH:quinone reductase-like Zn-dependent oxidoreductase/acyl carrier protein
MLRAAQLEHPGRITLIDLGTGSVDAGLIAAVLSAPGEEGQLAVRRGAVHAPLLAAPEPPLRLPGALGDDWRLDVTRKGTLDSLALIGDAAARRPLAAGEIRIAVRAAGVNFRDVLIALGMYPGGGEMGLEAAGVVLDTAPDVTRFRPGDRVTGLFARAFGSTARTDQRLAVPVPGWWSWAEAASAPVAFLTAYHGLVGLAALRPGQRVLIHSAAGGVGLAAVQLARHLGAEVFGTASAGKWDALRAAGLDDDHIASSRDTGFERRFSAVTAGRGMDVVLNSLTGDFIDASLRLQPRGGHFLEIGKTDIRDPAKVAGRHPGISYQPFDLLRVDAGTLAAMLGRLGELFGQRVLRPLPVTTWDIRRAKEALRHFSQARQTGKVVLAVPPRPRPEGTVLITGGTGALGGLVARHLARAHGVRNLILLGRGDPEQAAGLRSALEEHGARVTVARGDVADRDALRRLLDSIPPDRPLTTVVHAAGTLADATIESLTPQRLDDVLRAKVDGAWHLHDLTRSLDAVELVLFSSSAGVFGHPGQANYGAANAFLDALARRRQASGLPTAAIAWGPWEDPGGMTRTLGPTDLDRMARYGILPLSAGQGLALFDAVRSAGLPAPVAVRLDDREPAADDASPAVPQILRDRGGARRRPRAGREAENGPTDHTADDAAGWTQRIVSLSPARQLQVLTDLVREQAAAVLGHGTPAGLQGDHTFKEAGFDSLSSVELRNALSSAIGLRLPAGLVFSYPTAAALAEYLRSELAPAPATAAGPEDVIEDLKRLKTAVFDALPDADGQAALTEFLQEFIYELYELQPPSTDPGSE